MAERKKVEGYRSVLDAVFKENKKFAEYIIESYLTIPATKNFVIIPDPNTLRSIGKKRKMENKRNMVIKYILRTTPKTTDILANKKSGQIFTFEPGLYYNINFDNDKIFLNSVEIQLVDPVDSQRGSVFVATAPLIPKKRKVINASTIAGSSCSKKAGTGYSDFIETMRGSGKKKKRKKKVSPKKKSSPKKQPPKKKKSQFESSAFSNITTIMI